MQVTAMGPERLPEFLGLPARLHGRDPLWVPPLALPVAAELTGRDAFSRHARLQPFLAARDGVVLGRAVALVNERLRDEKNRPVGQVGYFECEDDAATAGALFEACFAWLRTQGASEVVGPMNGAAHRAHRLMVKGFERDPFLLEPRNPAYYVRLFEVNGFRPFHSWKTYELARPAVERLNAMMKRAADRAWAQDEFEGVRFDPPRDPMGVLARIHPLLDRAWAGHVGYTAIDPDELAETFAGLLAIMTSQCAGLVRNKKAARDDGFSFMFPDYVKEVRALQGDATKWGHWLASSPLPKRLVLHTVAISPEARGTGIAFALCQPGLEYFFEGQFEELFVALVTEEFRFFERGGEAAREYALFKRAV